MCALLGCANVMFVLCMVVLACVLPLFVLLCGVVWLFAVDDGGDWLVSVQWLWVVADVVVVAVYVICLCLI